MVYRKVNSKCWVQKVHMVSSVLLTPSNSLLIFISQINDTGLPPNTLSYLSYCCISGSCTYFNQVHLMALCSESVSLQLSLFLLFVFFWAHLLSALTLQFLLPLYTCVFQICLFFSSSVLCISIFEICFQNSVFLEFILCLINVQKFLRGGHFISI